MSMPYREMPHWGQMPVIHDTGAPTFRQRMHGAEWSMQSTPGGGDPRLTPSGDIARRGTIPPYTPYAVINPGRVVNRPQ